MSTFSLQYTFTADTDAVASEVNTNFSDISDFLNDNLVHLDGSKTMTGALVLPASDPVSANQAARKSYVDAGDASNLAALNLKAKALASNSSIDGAGTAAPTWASTQLLVEGGRQDVTTNAAGDFTLTFPTAFPNGVLAVVVTSLIAARNFYFAVHDTGTKAAVAVRVYQHDGTVLVSSSTTVSYIALGW